MTPTVFAQCAFQIGAVQNFSTINLFPVNATGGGSISGITDDAAALWSNDCTGMGFTYPQLNVAYGPAPAADLNVAVIFNGGVSTDQSGRCGHTTISYDAQDPSKITGITVNMWQNERAANGSAGADCTATWTNLVAHEIGHVLGLDDADGIAMCDGTIMGSNPSYVSSDQCNAVDDNFYTAPEEARDIAYADNNLCTMECWTSCTDGSCPGWGGGMNSPILIDTDGNGFHLTDVSGGVRFDLDADGVAEKTAWTRGSEYDGFLCLDRNHNGTIDSGAELFGNHTPLSSGATAPNGYEALKEFDLPAMGGNGNGAIDTGDSIWQFLRVWIDSNHNGISEPSELHTLDSLGITRIDLSYIRENREDGFGNLFRFKSKAWMNNQTGQSRASTTYDVFFLEK